LNSSFQKVKEFWLDKELDADAIWVCAGERRGAKNDAECACTTNSANMATVSYCLQCICVCDTLIIKEVSFSWFVFFFFFQRQIYIWFHFLAGPAVLADKKLYP